MFAAATSFFSGTSISRSYNIGPAAFPTVSSIASGFGSTAAAALTGSRSSTPGPSSPSHATGSNGSTTATGGAAVGAGTTGTGNLPTTPPPPTFLVGFWRVQSATHKVTHKRVSVWTFDKRTEGERVGAGSKERVLEVLRAEASALSRLRHPNILEMVEPLEETKSELIFATEPVLSSLKLSIPGSTQSSNLVELDEVEIQKGVLQLCKGLSFLHSSARLIHSNISPESILINSSGDWKLSGLGLTIPLVGSDGSPTPWRTPMYDSYMPPFIQRSIDYMAPEYALDEQIVLSSDVYCLGCVLYAVHNKGQPPFKNHNNFSTLRENAGRPLPGIERLEPDLRALLNSMITRHPQNRPALATLSSYAFFSSLPISTLSFLDRSTFASRTREEKVSFMRGLTSVLKRFSEGLRTRKILPSLLEEMKDTHLVPYILPSVFSIASSLSPTQFATLVLPSLKPLFAIKEPPQNMIILLDNLSLLQQKTDKAVFREHVLPLVYNALESEHTLVQERALKVVPNLCDTIDYAEVQGVLFPRVALVFSKTRILSVKVTTLQTFLSMVKTLDQLNLTQKLVPLLSKIRTKEPAVMLATLDVQEAMGIKVDREAVATLVLPQLWTMSMGPLLNVEQFQRFMNVIKRLGERVEREHNQHLRDSQRIEDRSTTANTSSAGIGMGGSLDFESLVGGANGTVKPDSTVGNGKTWEDDVWGSLLGSGGAETPTLQQTSLSNATTSPKQAYNQSLPSSPRLAGANFPLAPVRNFSGPSRAPIARQTQSSPLAQSSPSAKPMSPISSSMTFPVSPPMLSPPPPKITLPHQPTFSSSSYQTRAASPHKPNYNISLPMVQNMSPMSSLPLNPSTPAMSSMPAMSSILTPTQLPSSGTGRKPTMLDLGDFDPLA